MNSFVGVGKLTRHPTVRFEETGQQTTTFTLLIEEAGCEGKAFTLYLPCIAWGRAANRQGDSPSSAGYGLKGNRRARDVATRV
jgi:single-stranded DNA-binding protein